IGLLVLTITEAPTLGWSSGLVLSGFGLTIIATAVFVLWELRTQNPVLDVRYFMRAGFGSGSFSVTVQFLVTFGMFLILVQYLQLILGYSPLGAALMLAPMIAPLVIVSAFAPSLATRLGFRWTTAI